MRGSLVLAFLIGAALGLRFKIFAALAAALAAFVLTIVIELARSETTTGAVVAAALNVAALELGYVVALFVGAALRKR